MSPETIDAMLAAGATADIIAAAWKSELVAQGRAAEQRRAKDRERQRRKRSRDVTRTERDPSPKEIYQTPTEVTPTPSGVGPKQSKSRGTRLPDDWQLPPDWAAWAKSRRRWTDGEIAEEAILFANYWQSRSGAGAVHRNWFKTWQNWAIRSHRKDGPVTAAERTPAEAREWYLRNAEAFEKFGKHDDAERNRRHAQAIEEEHPELADKVTDLVGHLTGALRVSRRQAA